MDFLVRASCNAQSWLLRHPGGMASLLLRGFYTTEVLLYQLAGALPYLERRRRLLGDNYATLGRLVIGAHGDVAQLLRAPQQRGPYIAAGHVLPQRFPRDFPLFHGDAEAGGDGQHEVLHRWLWSVWLHPAEDRLEDPKLEGWIADAASELASLPQPLTDATAAPVLHDLVIRYMMWALLQIDVDESQLAQLRALAYSDARKANYVARSAHPFVPSDGALATELRELEALAELFASSPLFAEWEPAEHNNRMDRLRLGQLLQSLMLIAAFGGSGNLVLNAMVCPDHSQPLDLDDARAVMGLVLEAARIRPPVNHVNTVLTEPQRFVVGGQSLEFPIGTVVAVSLAQGCLDPSVFVQPRTFDAGRDNLEADLLAFNAVGFHPEPRPDARRVCPGRNVAVRFASKLVVAYRRALLAGSP